MKHNVVFYICLLTSVLLIVTGFLVPPMGVIDGSVLQAVGELLGFGTIGMLPTVIRSAKSTRITTKSGTTVELQTHDKKEDKK